MYYLSKKCWIKILGKNVQIVENHVGKKFLNGQKLRKKCTIRRKNVQVMLFKKYSGHRKKCNFRKERKKVIGKYI